MPTGLFESVAGGPVLPAGEWLVLPAANDSAILLGPRTYDMRVQVKLTGTTAGKRFLGRFLHENVATGVQSHALEIDATLRDGETFLQFIKSGRLPAGNYLKFEAFSEVAGVTVAHRVAEGLHWPTA